MHAEFARGPRNYALAECPWGFCPRCEAELAECECPPEPPKPTPHQVEVWRAQNIARWLPRAQKEAPRTL